MIYSSALGGNSASGWINSIGNTVRGKLSFRTMLRLIGPIVRVGPNEVHVKDSSWVNALYAGPRAVCLMQEVSREQC